MARESKDPIEKIRKQQARRVRNFSDHELDQIKTMTGIGLGVREIASVLMPTISGMTALNELEAAMRADERVLFAVELGLAQSKAVVGRSVFQKASTGDVGAQRLYLGWVHKVDDKIREAKEASQIRTIEDLIMAAQDDQVPAFMDAQASEISDV